MERFISRGLICKCATHFSPPAKKIKLTLIIFESLHQNRKRVLWKEKETEKRGSFATRVCRFKRKESKSSPTFIQSSPMASGMVHKLLSIFYAFDYLEMYMILDPWFNLIRVIVVIISNMSDMRVGTNGGGIAKNFVWECGYEMPCTIVWFGSIFFWIRLIWLVIKLFL